MNCFANKDAFLFDFDGTLVDSMPTWSGKMLHVLQSLQLPYPPDIIKTLTPLGDRGSAEYFIRTYNLQLTVPELIARMDDYARIHYEQHIPAKDTVPETLQALRRKGCSLNVLTASPHRMLDPCLRRLGLYELFDHVWSCDDFARTKAEPEIYREAAAQLGLRCEQCVFADDNINALRTAKCAGMAVIGVYDDSSADDASRIRALSDAYIGRFSELLDTL